MPTTVSLFSNFILFYKNVLVDNNWNGNFWRYFFKTVWCCYLFAEIMDLPLDTIDVWQVDGDIEPRDLLKAIGPLLSSGDVVLFGAYEPTDRMDDALQRLGATRHGHLDGFFMSFEFNRSEHPNGCAFEYVVQKAPFEDILQLDDSVLSQKDIPSFYDHILAFRPGVPRLPLMTFHDAACGGTLYLSGHYSESEALGFAGRISRKIVAVQNPVLTNQK